MKENELVGYNTKHLLHMEIIKDTLTLPQFNLSSLACFQRGPIQIRNILNVLSWRNVSFVLLLSQNEEKGPPSSTDSSNGWPQSIEDIERRDTWFARSADRIIGFIQWIIPFIAYQRPF